MKPVFNVMPSSMSLNTFVEMNPAASLSLCHFIENNDSPDILFDLVNQLRYKFAVRDRGAEEVVAPLNYPFEVTASSVSPDIFVELTPVASGCLSGFIRHSENVLPEISALGKQLQYHYSCRKKSMDERKNQAA